MAWNKCDRLRAALERIAEHDAFEHGSWYEDIAREVLGDSK